MIVLGLTGSIGMGKTTTAQIFRDLGIPVYDADETVRRIYSTWTDEATRRRKKLLEAAARTPVLLDRIEEILHPQVEEDLKEFLRKHRGLQTAMVLLDIPLLFEKKLDCHTQWNIVVTTTPEIQRERVLARSGMTEAGFETLLARQMPDSRKIERADYVLDTGKDLESIQKQVLQIVRELKGKPLSMQATVRILPKDGVHDPQGEAIRRALDRTDIRNVRQGKLITFEFDARDMKDAQAQIEQMCQNFLANPVIEQYEISVTAVQPATALHNPNG